MTPNDLPYRLGLPLWANPAWKGRYFDATPSMLASYARVFNAVEGNTTFHAVPTRETASSWQRALDGGDCRVCFKLPKTVTHVPAPSRDDLARFIDVIGMLGENLGPLLLQFSDEIGPREIVHFKPVFEMLEAEWPLRRRNGSPMAVVEVRHRAFFAEPGQTPPSELSLLLERYGFGRAMLDTRALYQGDRTHPDVVGARHHKPDVPLFDPVHAAMAFIRLVLHPDGVSNERWIDDWAARAARLIAAGTELYLMVHCPNNDLCPTFAARLHERLRARVGAASLPPLPSWPVPQQSELF